MLPNAIVGGDVSGKPEILVLGVGGTISAAPDERGHSAPERSAADILASVPGAAGFVRTRVAEVSKIPSRAITPQDMCSLAHEISSGVASGCDGVVITHGTDTLEETAYALALQLHVDVPVVLTGAMRLAHEAGADGPGNLAAALRVASAPEAASLGPVVVMHDEIHAARWVTKLHTSRVASFSSPGFGPVGEISEGRLRLLSAPRPAVTAASFASSNGPTYRTDYIGLPDRLDHRVELVWVSAGTDGLLVEAAVEEAGGLVLAGTGGGHVPPTMVEALEKAVDKIPVVLTSRCATGPVLEETYGGVGSETHLQEMGLLSAGLLTPLKARLRLMVALALGTEPGRVFPA